MIGEGPRREEEEQSKITTEQECFGLPKRLADLILAVERDLHYLDKLPADENIADWVQKYRKEFIRFTWQFLINNNYSLKRFLPELKIKNFHPEHDDFPQPDYFTEEILDRLENNLSELKDKIARFRKLGETLAPEEIKKNFRVGYQKELARELDCQPTDVALEKETVTTASKVYVGPLFPEIFTDFKNLERIFVSYPDHEIQCKSITVENLLPAEQNKKFKDVADSSDARIASLIQAIFAKTFSNSRDKNGTEAAPLYFETVCLEAGDLDFSDSEKKKKISREEILSRAREFGLKVCPAIMGPYYALADASGAEGLVTIMMAPLKLGKDKNVFAVRFPQDEAETTSKEKSPQATLVIEPLLVNYGPTERLVFIRQTEKK